MSFTLSTKDGQILVNSSLPDTPENRQIETDKYRNSLNPQTLTNGPGAATTAQQTFLSPASELQRQVLRAPQSDTVRASVGQQFRGSLPPDPTDKVRFYAQQFFPDMDATEAMSNFSYRPDGNLQVFNPQTNQNELVEADAQLTKPSSYLPALPKQAGDLMTDVAAGVGAVVGTLRGQPTVGTVFGAGVGDAARQGLSRLLTETERPFFDRAKQTGKRVAEEAVFTKLGDLGSKGIEFAKRFRGIANPSSTNLQKEAKKLGITLTAGEAANNSRAIIMQKTLSRTPDAADVLDNFNDVRNEAARVALLRWINQVQPNPGERSTLELARSAQKGAQEAINTENAALIAQASPLYEEAINLKTFASLADKPPGVTQKNWEKSVSQWQNMRALAKKDNILRAELAIDRKNMFVQESAELAKIEKNILEIDDALNNKFVTKADQKRLKLELGRLKKLSAKANKEMENKFNSSMFVVDATKKYIDKMISKADNYGDANTVAILQRTKTDILQSVDNQVPAYGEARKIYEEGYPSLNMLNDGLTGRIAGRRELTVETIPAFVFNSTYANAASIKTMREAFNRAGRSDAWNDLTRAYLEQQLDIAQKGMALGEKANVGANFARGVFGSVKQVEILREALSDNPEALKNLEWVGKTMAAINLTSGKESITAFANASMEDLKRKGMGTLPRVVKAMQIWQTPAQAAEAIANYNQGKYNRKLAEIITSGADISEGSLFRLKPGSKAAVMVLVHLLSSTGMQMMPNEQADLPTQQPQQVP